MKGGKTEIRPNVWRLRVYIGRSPTGTALHASRTFHGGKRGAENALRAFVEEVMRTRTPERGATVERLLEAWLEASAPDVAPRTLESYRYYIARRLVPEFGKLRIDQLNAGHLDRVYARWQAEGLSRSTVRKLHSILSAALNQAVKWEWLDRSPTTRARVPSVDPAVNRSIAPEEIVQLIQTAREHNPALAMAISLGAVTGARRGELCALRWSDLDKHTLTISRSLSIPNGGEAVEGPTKTHQVRRMILDDGTMRLLDWWREQQKTLAHQVAVPLDRNPYIISDQPRGDRSVLPNTLTHQFSRLAKKLGLPYHFHELRHFAATTMIAGGIDPRMAATRLGHARPDLTLRVYSHATKAADQRAAELLGGVLPELPS